MGGAVETLLNKIDPSALAARTALNCGRGFVPEDLRHCLEANRWRHEQKRAELYFEIYSFLFQQGGGAGFQAGERLLELGAGPGLLADYFAQQGLLTTSFDLKDSRLIQPEGVDFVIGAGQNLPFEDGCFDYVSVTSVLHHIPKEDHLAVIEEAKRVLRAAGVLLVQEDIREVGVKHLLVRGVDCLASGPEANSHRTVKGWLDFFSGCGLRLLASQELTPEYLMVKMRKRFFVLEKV